MRVHQTDSRTAQFRMLSDDQCEEIFYSALKVMERTGAKIYDENALKLLKDAGAWATDGNTAHIPSALAKESLNTAPSRITVYDRSGKPAMFLEDHKIYFGTGSDCPFLLDSFTGERRKFTRKDVTILYMMGILFFSSSMCKTESNYYLG